MATRTKAKEEQIQRMMKHGNWTREEAEAIYAADKEVDSMTLTQVTADLNDEQRKVMKKYTTVDTHTKKNPTVYKFDKPKRKENATKAEMIAAFAQFLIETGYAEVTVTNKERQIAFQHNGEHFELTLVQKRKPK